MARVINFNAGPAALPLAALERAQKELLDLEGTGMSVIEHSHRGKAYAAVHDEALALTRELLGISDDYEVLLVQGGASQQFALVPMNLLGSGQSADYVLTGSWSKKALKEAKSVGSVRVAGTTEQDGKFRTIPTAEQLELDPKASYVHITSNNTIAGSQWRQFPDVGDVPLVADMSSDIMSRPLDVSKFGIIYAGAQKNLGPSGLAMVIVRKSLVEQGRNDIPAIFQYRTHAAAKSLYHTPPTFAVYLLRNVLLELKQAGGLAAVEKHNEKKAKLVYDAIDQNAEFYRAPVAKECRSLMNIVFNLPTPDLEAEFVAKGKEQGMEGLKGHRSVGGIRVSAYNAATLQWIDRLVGFMDAFKKAH